MGLQRRSLREALSRRGAGWGLLLAMVFWLGAWAIVFQSRQQPLYRAGELADRPIVTRVDLTWENKELTDLERVNAREKAPSVFVPNTSLFETARQELLTLPANVRNSQTVGTVAEEIRDDFALNNDVLGVLKGYQVDGQPTEEWTRLVDELLADLRWMPIVRADRYQLEKANRATDVRLTFGDADVRTAGEILLVNLGDNEELGRKITSITGKFPKEIRPHLAHYFQQWTEPAYLLDNDATRVSKEEAEKAVLPVQQVFRAGDVIVAAGTVLDPADEQLLRVEQLMYRQQLSPAQHWLLMLGPGFATALLTAGLAVVVLSMRPRIAENPMRGLALACLLLAALGLAWSLEPIQSYATPAVAAGAAMLTAIILVIAYDQPFAIAVVTIQALLIALALNLSVGLVLVTMAAGVIAVAQLRQIRQRGALVRTGFTTGLVVAAGVFAVGLAERQMAPGVLGAMGWEALYTLVASVVVGFFVLGMLPFVERAFKVTTAMTLLELSDVNQPLLRKLAQAAPGTYNHSLNLAVIAEAAAEAVGADGLLCRVGAYYHDIGKMNKPQYFIENQGGGPNRHDKLSPAMSLLIIVGHVKDGMEMAREYGLPSSLIHFIESHHGTTLVEYFYHAARQQTGEGDAQPSEFEFRYPGPKPLTREAGIVMLTDTVESAARTMSDPTVTRIEQLVHKLAMKRLMDGQFDECGITLEDLHRIEEATTKALAGIYHGRIKYPTAEKPQPTTARQAG